MPTTAVNIPDLSLFLTQQILEFSKGSTVAILEGHQSKIKKLLGRFSKSPEKESQRFKLHFHLFIAYLAVALVDLQVSTYFNPHTKPIVQGVVDLFYETIDGDRMVIGEEFVKDQEERDGILSNLRRVDSKAFSGTGLPRMGMRAITDLLLEKRLNQYREMWLDDLSRTDQDGFFALMPTLVYQHWSGNHPRSLDSLTFSTLLSLGLFPFSSSLSQALSLLTIK